jgi:DNA polymerase-3 subunit alpha
MQFPNLVFERFIDISRADLPDIDLDFDSHQRHRIFEYLTAKYGEGHVANIGSFTQYKSKLALDDVARVFKVPPWEIKKVKEVLVERSSGDLRASAGIEDTVEQFEVARVVFDKYPDMQHAMTIEGQYKGIGVHASGIAVASVPIDQYVAIYKRWVESQKEMRDVLCFDKWDSERQGITKLDILGLNTMSMIADALRMLDMKLEDLYDLPLDDPATIDTFHRADLTGLFQFDGRAVRSVCAALNPDNFIELADITALARPGPLHNGATSMYIDIKKGAAQVKLVHPLYDQICAATHNLIVYQEQILRIVTEIGGFDWTAASYIRKIISKKLGEEEFNRQWDRFWDGAREREVPESVARAIWTNCITSGTYAFNFAHSVAYGMLAYWTGWLKTHHAQVFYAASLINTKVDKKKPKHFELMRDAVKHGIAIRPPAPGRSGLTWKPAGKKALRAGWMQVPGIGRSKAEAIISVRPSTYAECLAARGIGAKTIETIKAFGEGDDPFKLFDMERRIEEAKGQVRSMDGWLPEPTHDCYGIPHETTDEDTPVVWIGVILQRNLRDIFEVNKATQRPGADPETVKDPHLREWMILTGADGTEQAKFAIKRFNYPKYREMLWGIRLNEDVVLIAGKKSRTAGFRYVNIDRIWNLTPEEEEDDVAAEEQEVMA